MPRAKQVIFISRAANQRIVQEPKRTRYNQHGEPVGRTEGVTHEFVNGRLVLDEKRDKDAIEYIRGRIGTPGGANVYEVDRKSLAPDPAPLLAEIATSPPARVKEILEAEKDGYEREIIIDTAQARLAEKRPAGRPPKNPKATKLAGELSKLGRPELNKVATQAGVTEPEGLDSNEDVIEAIQTADQGEDGQDD